MANPSANPPVAATNGTSGMMAIYSRHWGPERSVQILRDPTKSLGISIVGGKVYSNINSRLSETSSKVNFDLLENVLRRNMAQQPQVDVASGSGAPITGIFIKNVLPESPAGRTGQLRVRELEREREYKLT